VKALPTAQVVAGLACLLGAGFTLTVVCAALWISGDGVPRGVVATGFVGAGFSMAVALWLAGRFARQEDRRLLVLAASIERHQADDVELPVLADESDSEAMTRLVRSVESLWTNAAEQISDLRSRGEVLRSLLESSPSGILVTGPAGKIRYLNATFERLVRLRMDPVGHLPIEAVRVAEVQTVVDRALTGKSSTDVACVADPYELLLQAAPLADGGALVLAQDVTRFRLAERARTDFVANVSHELRTPLTAILGFAETLVDDRARLPEDALSLLDRIYRNARRLRDLFEDLLTLSRIEARRGELPIVPQQLRPILAEALASAADLAHERGQSFELRCKRGLMAPVNPEALSTIVSNLVMNACHYTPEGGAITVSVALLESEVRIDVVDDGIGIDPAHHQRIFERFYRVDEGRSRRKGGTGLGLAIVKHMALASGARITLTSTHGKGSTFSLHIPR
jgi:two-component system phosphate regulon sensor histidine kinase PhoR